MKNENYIMLNGKKIELTDEQVKLIQADEPRQSLFDRVEYGEPYYTIDRNYEVDCFNEEYEVIDQESYESGNYCTDESIMKQHALHMLLNNLLWRYSMTHGGDKVELNNANYIIYYNLNEKNFSVCWSEYIYQGMICFNRRDTALAAIEEIVKPFIKAHPDFDVIKM